MTKKEETKKTAQTEQNQQTQPALQINSQYIKDLSFEAPSMPFMALQEAPKVDISVNINAGAVNKEKNLFTVELILKVEAKAADKTAFICELTYGALVTLNVPQEHLQPLLLIEVPHLLFPYVRAIIANTTREAGIMPLTLAPIDFAALYRARVNEQNKGKEKAN